MSTIELPSGAVVRHASKRRYHLVESVAGIGVAWRLTSRDDLLLAVNAYHAHRRRLPADVDLWLIDAKTGAVVRPLDGAE